MPEASPYVVVIESGDIAAIPLPPGFEPLAEQSNSHEHHLVVASGASRLRLCLRVAPPRCPDCLIILRDQSAAIRLAAASRCERIMLGFRPVSDRAASLSFYRRTKLIQLLTIHDALDAGADPRDIAFSLVFPQHNSLIGATWKGSGERRHTLRLIADARRLVTTGYRKLLLHR
jgi:hypothetical protein